jgi:DNA invertase Pin-like site-specific DNA recombinase
VQIAESIARGQRLGPFETVSEPQKVLYIDLEMNEKQFESRYAADHNGGRARFLHKHYKFSDDLIRVEFDPTDSKARGGESSADGFCRVLRDIIEETNASVVIVDSLTALKRSCYGTREIFDVMKGLKRLKNELDLSILVLFQTPKHDDSLELSAGRSQHARMLDNRADSVFGIGHSRHDATGRYIKQIKMRSDVIVYDSEQVAAFRLRKKGGNFLGFEFDHFAREIDLLTDIRQRSEWKTIEQIKRLNDNGMSIRAIATEIGLPRTTVHRLLKMWRPPAEPKTETRTSKEDFPGCDEYDMADSDPRFEGIYECESEEALGLRREAYLIEAARARARREYLETGRTPGLKEMLAKMNGEAEKTCQDMSLPPVDKSVPSVSRIPGTRTAVNAYGREIFIEKEEGGKPSIWYEFDRSGRKRQMQRNGTTIRVELIE